MRFSGQPRLVTLFSGDAFNPSLESSVTKGKPGLTSTDRGDFISNNTNYAEGSHMVPVLNTIGTDVACVGVSLPLISQLVRY